jgi:hypothetical protein
MCVATGTPSRSVIASRYARAPPGGPTVHMPSMTKRRSAAANAARASSTAAISASSWASMPPASKAVAGVFSSALCTPSSFAHAVKTSGGSGASRLASSTAYTSSSRPMAKPGLSSSPSVIRSASAIVCASTRSANSRPAEGSSDRSTSDPNVLIGPPRDRARACLGGLRGRANRWWDRSRR